MAPTSTAALCTAMPSCGVTALPWNKMRNTWNGNVDRLLATGDDKIASRESKKQTQQLQILTAAGN